MKWLPLKPPKSGNTDSLAVCNVFHNLIVIYYIYTYKQPKKKHLICNKLVLSLFNLIFYIKGSVTVSGGVAWSVPFRYIKVNIHKFAMSLKNYPMSRTNY